MSNDLKQNFKYYTIFSLPSLIQCEYTIIFRCRVYFMAGYVLTWSFRKTKVIKWKEREKERKKKNLTLIFRSLHWLWLKFSFYACRLLLPRNIWLVFFFFPYICIYQAKWTHSVCVMHGNGAMNRFFYLFLASSYTSLFFFFVRSFELHSIGPHFRVYVFTVSFFRADFL